MGLHYRVRGSRSYTVDRGYCLVEESIMIMQTNLLRRMKNWRENGFRRLTWQQSPGVYVKSRLAGHRDPEGRTLISRSLDLCCPAIHHLLTPLRTNSKATVRLHARDLLPLIPTMLHATLKASKHYASRSDSIVVQSDSSRKQGENVEECFHKLHQLIVHIGETKIPGETSSQQVNRVQKLCVVLIYGYLL